MSQVVVNGRVLDADEKAIVAMLDHIVITTRPAWSEAWIECRYGNDDADKRLDLYRQIRASGDLPEAASFYLIAWQIKLLTPLHIVDEMDQIDKDIDLLFAKHGLHNWWCNNLKQFDVRNFEVEHPDEWARYFVHTMHAYGEERLERLYKSDRGRFQELLEEGQRFFEDRRPESA